MGICDIENLDSNAMISPKDVLSKSEEKIDVCIINFSYKIMDALIEDELVEFVDDRCIRSVACNYPLYRYKGTNIGIIRTTVGAPMTACIIEEAGYCYSCNKFVMFGSCGGLDKDITEGKIIVPTYAYRDEGMSYHYAHPADYIEIKNCDKVVEVLESLNVDYVKGKTWTTDAFYRETYSKYKRLKSEGCIAVEMEVAACQAVADWRNAEFYTFLYRGDNLDSKKWERGILDSIQVDERLKHFFIALEIAKSLVGAKIHKMKLFDSPFQAVKSGSKKVELRLFDEKRKAIKNGDVIEFSNTDSGESFRVRVADISVYKNFEELYADYDKIALGYGNNDIADPNDMLEYYALSDIEKYGVVAIGVCPL